MVVALLALVAAVAVPRLAASSDTIASGEAAARPVASMLQLARRMAIEQGATNASGYQVQCNDNTYRIVNQTTTVAEPAKALADGWRFEDPSYSVLFNPYGGATPASGKPPYLAIVRRTQRWLVRFDPATGYVWVEKAQ